MGKKDDPGFWSEVKSYLKKNESSFGNRDGVRKQNYLNNIGDQLLGLTNVGFEVAKLMELEELI